MILKDVSLESPQENILFDEVLLHLAEQGTGKEVLRFWESKIHFVVLGRISKLEEDVHREWARRNNIPLVRRFSGGGTVLQGPGCLNFSLILSKDRHPALRDLHRSYRFILGEVGRALSLLKVDTVFYPPSDLALAQSQKKISGNAQHRAKRHILHHGTLLYQFDLTPMEKLLKIPLKVPEYRQNRSHRDFVTNIPVQASDLKKTFKTVFQIDEEQNTLTASEFSRLKEFLAKKNITIDPKF